MKKWRGPASGYQSRLPRNEDQHLSISEEDEDRFLQCDLLRTLQYLLQCLSCPGIEGRLPALAMKLSSDH